MLQFRKVANQREMEAVYTLRYNVYCLEKGFLPAEDYPDHMEKDEFDTCSTHFLAINTDDGQDILGCFRLILPSGQGFPCEQHFALGEKSPDFSRTAELSRLIVAPNARKDWRHILMGLSKEIYLYNHEKNLVYNYAVMDKFLIVILQRLGLPFRVLTAEGSYMGDTLPSLLSMITLEEVLPHINRWYYDYLLAPRDEQENWF